jgi:uncharacterized protein (DUF433 family)
VATLDTVIHSDPSILGGTPVFRGTRVPLKNLVDYLAAGDTLDEFLDHFPSVKREQAMAVLELAAKELLPACARPSPMSRCRARSPHCSLATTYKP